MYPASVVQDRAFEQLIRRRFFRGVTFDEPIGDPGWFGRDSAVWYVHEHVPALVVGLFSAALIETLHPDFAWMGRDHSRSVERVEGVATGRMDPEGVLTRAGHSYSFFMSVAYGSSESAERVTRAVRGMHSSVQGVRPDGVRYDATDPETLRWAYATVVWGIASAHERYHARPLADIDDYYREFVRVGEALGGVDLPRSKAEVLDYLFANVELMAVTLPTIGYLASLAGREQPRVLRPVLCELRWAVLDLQPDWAQQLLRVQPSALARARRAAVWCALNGIRYGAGPLREVTEARARAGHPEPRIDVRLCHAIAGSEHR